MSGSNAAHSALVDATLLRVGAIAYVRAWKRVVGTFYRVRRDQATGKVSEAIAVSIGVPGEPDLGGILTRWDGVGLWLGIELKTGNATQNPDQKAYQKMIESRGGVYILARTPEEALQQVMCAHLAGKPTHE